MPVNQFAHYPRELREESEKFIATLEIGQKLWPKYHDRELTVSETNVLGYTAIYFEEQPNAIIYPQRGMFCGPLEHWWRKNVKHRLNRK